MKLKRFVQKIFIFILIFAFVFGDFANTGIFSKGTVQVQAADKVADYNKKGHTLHSNANMGAVAVKELGHGSHTPFRKFVIDDKMIKMMGINVLFADILLGEDIQRIHIRKKLSWQLIGKMHQKVLYSCIM